MSALVIRVEASRAVGLGHVMRTLAVAEQAREVGTAVRYVVDRGPGVAIVHERGLRATAPGGQRWLDDVRPGDRVVFDGYGFTTDDERGVRTRGATVAAIDDRGLGRHDVDVLLDVNPHERTGYRLPPHARLLLGPRHALVRREFLARRRHRAGPPGTLLLTFGGSDPTGLLERVLPALAGTTGFEQVLAVVGPAGRPPPDVPPGVEVVRGRSDPAPLFDRADAAIAAAGATTWELMAMGVPVALVAAVDNQVPVRDGAARLGAALAIDAGDGPAAFVGAADQLTVAAVRSRLSSAGLDLVRGDGPRLLLEAIEAARRGSG